MSDFFESEAYKLQEQREAANRIVQKLIDELIGGGLRTPGDKEGFRILYSVSYYLSWGDSREGQSRKRAVKDHAR
jgi:hypothetical protein